SAAGERLSALRRAIELSDESAELDASLLPVANADRVEVQSNALLALTFRGVRSTLWRAVTSRDDESLIVAALRSIRTFADRSCFPLVLDVLERKATDELRDEALKTAVVLGVDRGLEIARKEIDRAKSPTAMLALAAKGDDQDIRSLVRLLQVQDVKSQVL